MGDGFHPTTRTSSDRDPEGIAGDRHGTGLSPVWRSPGVARRLDLSSFQTHLRFDAHYCNQYSNDLRELGGQTAQDLLLNPPANCAPIGSACPLFMGVLLLRGRRFQVVMERRMPTRVGSQHTDNDHHEHHQHCCSRAKPCEAAARMDGWVDLQTYCKIRTKPVETRCFPLWVCTRRLIAPPKGPFGPRNGAVPLGRWNVIPLILPARTSLGRR